MTPTIEGLTDSGIGKFEKARQILLPNEDPHFVCQIQKGFFVISKRRAAILKEDGQIGYRIMNVFPHDSITEIKMKKTDRAEIVYHTDGIQAIEIKAPQGVRGENKSELGKHFQSMMSKAMNYLGISSETHDVTYLERIPECLTRNAILDLNTILQDQPNPDELVHEATKFLGSNPFLLEESLRDGEDKENGILFAAGEKGYFSIQGKKDGRFMSNVVVDTVEWDNIRCIKHQWHYDPPLINVTFSLIQGGKETTMKYQWAPPPTDEILQFPWFLQSMNGPYIFEDIVYKYTETIFLHPPKLDSE